MSGVKKYIFGVVFFVMSIHAVFAIGNSQKNKHAIAYKTTTTNGLGDHLYTYMSAMLLAYKYDLDFYNVPFKYMDAFEAYNEGVFLDDSIKNQFDQVIEFTSESDLVKHLRSCTKPTLFMHGMSALLDIASRFAEKIQWPDQYDNLYVYMSKNPRFEGVLKKRLTLNVPINEYILPSGMISVAVHVRKGEPEGQRQGIQYDDEFERIKKEKIKSEEKRFFTERTYPLKFPPEQFYVDQIKKLSEVLDHCPLFVYVFTNDKKPKKLTERLRKRVQLSNVFFACRDENYKGVTNKYFLLEEIYNISKCDCLIRGCSGFSFIAQMMGAHKIVIKPQSSVLYLEQSLNQAMLKITSTTIFFRNMLTNMFEFECFSFEAKNYKHQALKALSIE